MVGFKTFDFQKKNLVFKDIMVITEASINSAHAMTECMYILISPYWVDYTSVLKRTVFCSNLIYILTSLWEVVWQLVSYPHDLMLIGKPCILFLLCYLHLFFHSFISSRGTVHFDTWMHLWQKLSAFSEQHSRTHPSIVFIAKLALDLSLPSW